MRVERGGIVSYNTLPMFYIGIDPGVSGGIAILGSAGEVVDVYKMPATDRDLFDGLQERVLGWFVRDEPGHAMLEAVHAGVFGRPGARMGVSSAFTFGRGYGKLEMLLTALKIPFDYVTPRKWQSALGCLSHGDKNITKRRAQQLFPTLIKLTHAHADALLLAEYNRRLDRGLVNAIYDSRGRTDGKTEGRTEEKGRPQAGEETDRQRTAIERAANTVRRGGKAAAQRAALATVARHGAGAQRAARSRL